MARTREYLGSNFFIVLFILISAPLLSIATSAADTDGDGVEDHLDDCPVAEGNSTVDRVGCPDKDGDGTSDKNDPWAIQSGGFAEDTRQGSNNDYYASLFSSDGTYYLTSDGSTMRIWDTSAKLNILSVSISGISDIAWSPNGTFVAASTNGDELKTYYSSNMTPLFSVDTGGEDTHELEYSSDGTMIAVVGARDGGSGDGQVEIFDSMNGTLIHSFEPAGEDQFYSVDWSPDSSRIVIGGDEDIWVYETSTWTQNASRNTNRGTINAIAWSPDGKSIAVCEAWASNNGARVRMIDYHSMAERWAYSSSTSCNDIEFSPDSTQVAASHTYYQSDGASIRVFKTHDTSATIVDTLAAPRPGGCTSGGGGNNCGSIYGLDWHPDGMYIISAHGRNDEGIYHWTVDPDIDNDGVLNADDAFPEDGTQWDDTDGDGFGDNPSPAAQPDSCITVAGTSKEDRFGCPDSDSDGYSDPDSTWTIGDGADVYINDPEQWADADFDGHGDNYLYEEEVGTELHLHQRGDAFPSNPNQWNDTDGDGWGDNFENSSWLDHRPVEWPGMLLTTAEQADVFPLDRYQWQDSDGDWVGDEPNTPRSDACPYKWGDSYGDRVGCPDTDGDGFSDPDVNNPKHPEGDADAFPNDPTQWLDTDGDGFGDNQSGNNPDDCSGEAGSSFEDRDGCPDMDGDGWSNGGDAMQTDPTQWLDRDGDGYGDNPNGSNPDAFPDDGTQWSDRDDDGYGDNPIGITGDWFPDDPTQWHDFDFDDWGDNPNGSRGDVCPGEAGPKPKSSADEGNPLTRGCPDYDGDYYPDPVDAFPLDPFQWNDTDGDGWGDNQAVANGDDCLDAPGTSSEANLQGCLDSDADGWADEIDAFPFDSYQWLDTDNDGWGDNYIWENHSLNLTMDGYPIRVEMGDAFPEDSTQWSNIDGDLRGDNPNGIHPDAFPLIYTQLFDSDDDGYGDNFTSGAYEPDDCSWAGASWRDRFGCSDSDNDGQSDEYDSCPWDPEIWEYNNAGVDCKITEDPSKASDDKSSGAANGLLGDNTNLLWMGGIIAFLMFALLIAQVGKQAARRSGRVMVTDGAMEIIAAERQEEEEARQQQWIDYYVQIGDLAKAKELGWEDPADLPQWKQHELEQAAEADAVMPTMVDLEDI
ncbi:hypothetical protein OAJ94_01365 [Deltaproteobacteria bacterium]|nr:hypothetical protein [Deltaproteobacteria bacterium]